MYTVTQQSHAAARYLLLVASHSPAVTSATVTGLLLHESGPEFVNLAQDDYQDIGQDKFVVSGVQLRFHHAFSVYIQIDGLAVTLWDETLFSERLEEVAGRTRSSYDSPELIPTCFWFDFQE